MVKRAGTFTIVDFRSGSGYLVPDLVGLTIAEAKYEWGHRYGTRTIAIPRPHNADYRDVSVTVDWEGFTGAVTYGGDPADIVAGFTTSPAGGIEGEEMPASTALSLLIGADLVTPGGDALVTPAGDQLIVAI